MLASVLYAACVPDPQPFPQSDHTPFSLSSTMRWVSSFPWCKPETASTWMNVGADGAALTDRQKGMFHASREIRESGGRNALKHGAAHFPSSGRGVDSPATPKCVQTTTCMDGQVPDTPTGLGNTTLLCNPYMYLPTAYYYGITGRKEIDRLHLGFSFHLVRRKDISSAGFETAEGLNQGWRNGNVVRPFRCHDSISYGPSVVMTLFLTVCTLAV